MYFVENRQIVLPDNAVKRHNRILQKQLDEPMLRFYMCNYEKIEVDHFADLPVQNLNQIALDAVVSATESYNG